MAKVGLLCSISTIVAVLIAASSYAVIISGLSYFKEPEPFGCKRKDNLTENIEKFFSIVSFAWAILFITVFVVISFACGCFLPCYLICDVDHFRIFEKKLLLIILNVTTIVGFPPPLFNISLFLYGCGPAYGILVVGTFLYFCTGIVTIVIESLRTGYARDKRWNIFKKAAGTALHVIELSASCAAFAGLFDSYTRAQRSISISYTLFASILAVSTWLRNILDSIEIYYSVIKKNEGSKYTHIASFTWCISHILTGVVLTMKLSYDILNNTPGATVMIALVLVIISIVGNIMYCAIEMINLYLAS